MKRKHPKRLPRKLLENYKGMCFSDANTANIKDSIKPTLRENPDENIVHVGTNDLASNKRAQKLQSRLMDYFFL